eukprot:COSAG02_NODE_934_length_15809_cov_59.853787_2_plen_420_part_00
MCELLEDRAGNVLEEALELVEVVSFAVLVLVCCCTCVVGHRASMRTKRQIGLDLAHTERPREIEAMMPNATELPEGEQQRYLPTDLYVHTLVRMRADFDAAAAGGSGSIDAMQAAAIVAQLRGQVITPDELQRQADTLRTTLDPNVRIDFDEFRIRFARPYQTAAERQVLEAYYRAIRTQWVLLGMFSGSALAIWGFSMMIRRTRTRNGPDDFLRGNVCALLAVGAIWVVIVLLFAAIGRRRAQRSAMHQTHDAVAEAYEMAKIAWIIPGVTFGGISLWFFEKVFDGSPAGIMLGWLTWIALSALLRLCWMRCSIFGRRNATAGRIGAWLMVYVLATCFVAVAVGASDDASRGVWILCLIWMFSSLVIPGICRSLCPAIVVGRESADDTSTCSRANIFFALFHLVVVCVAASVGAFWDF